MSTGRRIAGPNSKNRDVLLDAAERLLLSDGYAAVTSRRVAAEAGLKPQLVHYYFRTMDDLFLALFRRRGEEGLARQEAALSAGDPLRALWEYSLDGTAAAFTMEFMALANHRKAIRAEIAAYAARFREAQVRALDRALRTRGIDPQAVPPAVASVVLTSLSRMLVLEQALGMSAGHAETLAAVRDFLDRTGARGQRSHALDVKRA